MPNQLVTNSARFIPENWIKPLDLNAVFGRPAGPLEVDLGCGKGRFLLARAKKFPESCYLGIERLLARIKSVDRKIQAKRLTNIRLLYADANYTVRYLLPVGSVRTFFILFSDPWPKNRHASKRLFCPEFLEALAKALQPNGTVNLASDHTAFMSAAARLFDASSVFTAIPPWIPTEAERTDYELKYMALNRAITRLSYQKLTPNDAP